MPDRIQTYIQNLTEAIIPVTVLIIVTVIGYIIRSILFKRLSRSVGHVKSKLYDIVVTSTKGPFIIWFLMLGIYLAMRFSTFPDNIINVSGKILLALGLLSATIVAANISCSLIGLYSGKWDPALPNTSLTQNLARILVFGLGILIILNSLGINITPLLATLGVGGLAVALALQDTLSNLFAGFHIILNKIVRVGDYVKLESGEEGYVTDITWRTTKIRMLSDNTIMVPNAKLIQTIVTNYYYPEKDMAVLVDVGVHYASDLEKVEKITCETAKEVMLQVKGGVPEFEPFIRYKALGDSSIQFTVILRAKEFTDQYLIKHEFIKRLHERYKKEGINIPYPTRTVYVRQENA